MSGLEQIKSINSWAKSEERRRLAKSLNRSGKSEHKERPAVVSPKRGG